jgi:hypothetical protein
MPDELDAYVRAIRASGLSIYDPIQVGDPNLWISSPELEAILDRALHGLDLAYPLRTRSMIVKRAVCEALGYPVPASFKKTQPRFTGQAFDTYVQKSNNLQVWNEDLSSARRYVLIRVSDADQVTKVRVVTGDTLSLLDTTGTLTQKYQARCIPGEDPTELIVAEDTDRVAPLTNADLDLAYVGSPVDRPRAGQLLPIVTLFARLRSLVGASFNDAGVDQERNRGGALHRLVCEALGYLSFQDDGQFPDIRHQLLEVKLQTSPTIDLGLICPNSAEPLDVPMMGGSQIRHCDVRYAIFCGQTAEGKVTLSHFLLTTGEAFFGRFPQFQGKILNAKLQIPLPRTFFD